MDEQNITFGLAKVTIDYKLRSHGNILTWHRHFGVADCKNQLAEMKGEIVPYVNKGLYQLHRVLFLIYMILILFGGLVSVFAMSNPEVSNHSVNYLEAAAFFCFLPSIPCALHYLAATRVKTGKASGRILSRMMAWIMLFVFPVGTAIAIYLFKKTGFQWQRR